MTLPSTRLLFLLMFLAPNLLILTAIFVEPFKSLEPCPMCMMQRIVFFALSFFALIAAVQNPAYLGQKIYAALVAVLSLTGAGIASRQLWLQSLPEAQVPACGPGIDYMLEVFPILEVIEMAITGTGDCAEVQWTLLGISIPGWSLLAFLAFAVISFFILFRKKPESA